jgi:hypothetical protein
MWLIGYVCFDFSSTLALVVNNPGKTPIKSFSTDPRKICISWIMHSKSLISKEPTPEGKPHNESENEVLLRSQNYWGTVRNLWIPNHGVEFFIWFLDEVQDEWHGILDKAELFLDERVGLSIPFVVGFKYILSRKSLTLMLLYLCSMEFCWGKKGGIPFS